MKKILIIGVIIVSIVIGAGIVIWTNVNKASPPEIPTTSTVDQNQNAGTNTTLDSETNNQPIEVIISLQSAEEGVLSLNKTSTFKPNETIHVTALLPSDRLNTSVVLDFVYTVDKSQLGPMAKNPRQIGDKVVATYALTPPQTGWPIGEYSVTFIASPTEIISQTITVQ